MGPLPRYYSLRGEGGAASGVVRDRKLGAVVARCDRKVDADRIADLLNAAAT